MAFPDITPNLSPMMKQYIETKKLHPEMLLMYRLGDFYELFFDDAVTASRTLGLTLTGRDCGLPERAPMCGVPFHAVDSYIAKLIEKGYKVVIVDQTEDPSKAVGLVKREIVRIVTPGTVTDSSILKETDNNYLASVYINDEGFGLAVCDISTGILHLTESSGGDKAAVAELQRYSPSEVLYNSGCAEQGFVKEHAEGDSVWLKVEDSAFELEDAKALLTEQFGEDYSSKLKWCKRGLAAAAAGALIEYLKDTQFSAVSRVCSINCYKCEDYMYIPSSCSSNLELLKTMRSGERKGSFLWAIDGTVTSMGHRLLRSFIEKPLLSSGEINQRLDAVAELFGNSVLSGQLHDTLDGVYDIERLMTRITYGKCLPRDMMSLAEASLRVSRLKGLSSAFKAALLKKIAAGLDPFEDLRAQILATITEEPPATLKDGGYIKTGFSSEIDELRDILKNAKLYLSKLEAKVKEETGIKNLKVGFNSVFGYYFEVSNSQSSLVPDSFVRKQTLTNAERYISDELKELEDKIMSAGEKLKLLEKDAFDKLCNKLTDNLLRIQETAASIAYLDVLTCFAETARDRGYSRPEVDDSSEIKIENGRHPVVELVLKNELFVPNNTLLDCGDNLVNVLTGPNMSGKSTFMRQTALITIMAQMGSFVPASYAHIGVVDSIFTRVGASDDLFSGDSTFMVEMKEVAEILKDATSGSLVIMDEIGRGTSTFDGMSIARAVIEYICSDNGLGCKTLFATHYHELTDLDAEYSNVKNYNIAVRKRGDEITFLRRIIEGPADDSYGIQVAMLAGVPQEVTTRAKDILSKLESDNPERIERRVITTVNETTDRLTEELKTLHIETMTPIEAMSALDRLIRMARNKE